MTWEIKDKNRQKTKRTTKYLRKTAVTPAWPLTIGTAAKSYYLLVFP